MFVNKLHFKPNDFTKIKSYQDALFNEYDSKKVGYYHLPCVAKDLMSKIKDFKEKIDYEKVVVIGVGGSSLGAKAISSMIVSKKIKDSAKLYFLENVDPTTILHTLEKLNFDKTLFLIISKSGSTIETVSILKIVLEFFKVSIENRHFAVITDKNSPLESFAKKYALEVFHIYENVGGRFSALSAVGLVPLMLCGYNVEELLEGAKKCEEDIFVKKDITIFQKAYKFCSNKDVNTNVLFSYSDAFREINAWYIQLWAESLGKIDKKGERVGLTPIGLIGSVDQHSFLQLIMQGPKNKSVTFLRIKEFDTNLFIPDSTLPFLDKCDLRTKIDAGDFLNEQCAATMKSVIDEGIIVDEIILDKLDAFHAGYLIYYYEVLTSICGIIFDVSTYDQPGVEIGKKILLKKLGK